MNLEDFNRQLKEIEIEKIGRPFVCEGSPLECNTFLIGHNSATQSLFWEFWKPQNGGFNKSEWYENFKKENNISRRITRKRIEIFFEEFANTNIRLLQTNLYCFPSGTKNNLSDKKKYSNVLNFLLRTIKPKAIIAHGKEISTYLWNLNGSGFIRDKWFPAKILNFQTEIYCRGHLAKPGESDANCKELAHKMKDKLTRKFCS